MAGRPVRAPSGTDPSLLRVLIPQQAYVFSGTLRENLLYLRPDAASAAALEAASDAVGLDALVRRLGGFDAPLDPGALSQGERQLIALGRAYLSPAPWSSSTKRPAISTRRRKCGPSAPSRTAPER